MDRLRRLLIAAAFVCAAGPAAAQEAFSVGTNWLPDAERGGFYHAQAAGMYRKRGLDVTVQAGGPQLNNPQLLAAGRLDAVMVTSAVEAFNYAKNDVPIVAVAAIYQRNPQILISHKTYGIKSFEDMKGKPIMISSLARNGYWLWLKAKYGFSDDQILEIRTQQGGEALIDQLVQNSSTITMKSQFAQEKYIKKKKNK